MVIFTDSMKTMVSKSLLLVLFGFILHFTGVAQYKSAVIGVDGLTCSACSFATQKSLLELKSVDSVHMELETNTATVYFRPGQKVNVKDLAKKVVDAGFSVRSISATLNVNEWNATPNGCWSYENDMYHFMKLDAPKKLNGEIQLTFIGEKFMPAKEFKKWKMYSKNTCPPNGVQTLYSQDYYVTIQ
ncbi:MAG TPA: heavy metal-associated domain-containing protein [Bacteroidia bacterium]|jgi:copper chaperone CopZ|nr:heavy metal-associated domain-containing protein [Bacteroidia bacterium]